ncbi:unnamed protein product [Cuscuta epithymum]|uniref:Uncharacterized protein n=1 Tax=Cuscuta epithymum TaxID=186058 RepID=A0AAV0F6P1_9ASTE|nr:unnamed protein product [Cuscuta epithymum]CAH9131022.1 unnamed protein product [Cuscuta epithymum]
MQKLEPHQLALFTKTIFGPFLDSRNMCCSRQLIQYLLGNLVEFDNSNNPFHLYFNILMSSYINECVVLMLKFAEVLPMHMRSSKVCSSNVSDYQAKWAHDLYYYGHLKGRAM